jgi:hypothetical protein
MRRAYRVLALTLVVFVVVNYAVFHTHLYAYWLSTDASTSQVNLVLFHESIRPKRDTNQILAVGDSRMALISKVANGYTTETGYEHGSVAVPGSTPRSWYYILRAADPEANRYRAVVFGIDTYNDDEIYEDLADRESDLSYVITQLRWSDLSDFAFSFHTPARQWKAARGIALKGLVYKRDLADFLLHPVERVRTVRQSWQHSFNWFYDYRTVETSVAGLTVDWDARTMRPPDKTDERLTKALHRNLVEPLPKYEGRRSAYLKHWLGKIREHYQESKTKLVFVRLPRAPWIRPDLPQHNAESSVRQLARRPNVILLDENLFTELERPEHFHDEQHMNQPALDRFTNIAVHELRRVLGPPVQ